MLVLIATVVLPLLGVWLAGESVESFLEMPPRPRAIQQEPFSWPIFLGLASFIVGTLAVFVDRIVSLSPRRSLLVSRISRTTLHNSRITVLPKYASRFTLHERRAFPWWGWVGLVWTSAAWILAWNRFEWLGVLQLHTFTPLWVGYIVIINAVTYTRTGHCMLLHRPRYFLSLFPLSAGFWWSFEYLNRFVHNWYYVGAGNFSAGEYILLATLPFSTVLPAVLGTAEWLTSYPRIGAGLKHAWIIRSQSTQQVGWLVIIAATAGLLGIGLWPNYLYPLVWVAPLLLITGLQWVWGQPTIFTNVTEGDWHVVWITALSALICGVFWEMWNSQSLARWQYAVPFVHRFQIFEMPLLGYAGYLPFGLECLAVADLFLNRKFSGGIEYYATETNRSSGEG